MQRPRFTIRQIMLVVAACALLCAILRFDERRWLASALYLTAGPILGAVVQRRRGGRGILGGLIGGVVHYVGFGVMMYVIAYVYPDPDVVDYLGPGLSFLVLSSSGAGIGLGVGILVWGLCGFKSSEGPSRVSADLSLARPVGRGRIGGPGTGDPEMSCQDDAAWKIDPTTSTDRTG
jgi:hypothetical protein